MSVNSEGQPLPRPLSTGPTHTDSLTPALPLVGCRCTLCRLARQVRAEADATGEGQD